MQQQMVSLWLAVVNIISDPVSRIPDTGLYAVPMHSTIIRLSHFLSIKLTFVNNFIHCNAIFKNNNTIRTELTGNKVTMLLVLLLKCLA